MKQFYLFCISLLGFSLFAQENISNEKCGSDELHQRLMQQDESYRIAFEENERQIRQFIEANPQFRNNNETFVIPVVVHVIHLGEPVGTGNNISDAQILGAIQGLNDRFKNTNGLGVDFNMEFCMAVRDPNNQPTNGIMRVDGSGVPGYAENGINFDTDQCGANETAVKSLSRWPVSQYYNIWVVNRICGNWAGYAYYPWGGNNDGTVMARNFMTQGNITLAHELGHGFNLRHTFDGFSGSTCPPDDSCIDQGDRICDTPPHKQNDCGGTNPCSGDGIWDNSRRNFMSYCGTRNRFTAGQRERARAAAVVTPRLSLLSSLGCIPVGENDVRLISVNNPVQVIYKTNCSFDTIHPVIRFQNIGMSNLTHLTIRYQVNAGEEQTTYWTGNLASQGFMNMTLAPVAVNEGFNNFQIHLDLPNNQADVSPQNNTSAFSFRYELSAESLLNYQPSVFDETCPNISNGFIFVETTRRFEILEDFENDADGWILVNGAQPNQWMIGSDVASGGQNAIYISNNQNNNQYDLNKSAMVHFYKDFYLPVNATSPRISFDWRNAGETNLDILSVRALNTSVIPAAGYNLTQAALVGHSALANQAEFITANVNIVSFTPGSVLRIIFSWRNNLSSGNQPPAAVDNIRFSYQLNSNFNFAWSNGAQSNFIENLAQGTYSFQAIDQLGCTLSDTIEVGITNNIEIQIAAVGETVICEGDSLLILSVNQSNVTWSTGETGNQIYASNSGEYFATITEDLCVFESNSIQLQVLDVPEQPEIVANADELSSTVSAAAYQWYFNGEPIVGMQSQTLTATQEGVYQVEVFNEIGCSSTSQAFNYIPSNIHQKGQSALSIFPNPADRVVHISGLEDGQIILAELYNTAGKLIESRVATDRLLELSHITRGFYFLKIHHVGGMQTFKLMLMN
ncbi:MAG: zinc-dependent metalloprotease [Flavobacteriales bacterium]